MNDRSSLKKYGALSLVFVLCAGVFCLFGMRKTGLFVDEVYTYGLSNSAYAPFLYDVKGGDLHDVLFTRSEAEDYLTVRDDGFSFASVYYNQTRDVHPPLYYELVHLVSSVFRGSCSKWIGLGINLCFYLLTLLVLYRLALLAFDNTAAAASAAGLYGLSRLAISDGMMIRMYMMLTFLTVLFALRCLQFLRMPDRRGGAVSVTAVLLSGLLTQYYFVFYAFFLCAAVDLVLLCRKDLRAFVRFSLAALAGVALAVVLFPACLHQIFRGNGEVVGGTSVTDNLKNTAQYLPRIRYFLQALQQMSAVKWVLFGALVLLVLLLPRLLRGGKGKGLSFDVLTLLVPVLPAFAAVAILSPVREFRYLYNLGPFPALAAGWLLAALFRAAEDLPGRAVREYAAAALCLCAALFSVRQAPPDNLFPEMRRYDEAIAPYTGDKCIYLTDGYYAPETQDLLQLRQFESFFITGNTASPELLEYLGDAEEVVVYIDTGPFWSSGYDEEEMLALLEKDAGVQSRELLYRYDLDGLGGLSVTYLVRR